MIILTVLSALVLSTVLIILSQKVKTPHDKFIILFLYYALLVVSAVFLVSEFSGFDWNAYIQTGAFVYIGVFWLWQTLKSSFWGILFWGTIFVIHLFVGGYLYASSQIPYLQKPFSEISANQPNPLVIADFPSKWISGLPLDTSKTVNNVENTSPSLNIDLKGASRHPQKIHNLKWKELEYFMGKDSRIKTVLHQLKEKQDQELSQELASLNSNSIASTNMRRHALDRVKINELLNEKAISSTRYHTLIETWKLLDQDERAFREKQAEELFHVLLELMEDEKVDESHKVEFIGFMVGRFPEDVRLIKPLINIYDHLDMEYPRQKRLNKDFLDLYIAKRNAVLEGFQTIGLPALQPLQDYRKKTISQITYSQAKLDSFIEQVFFTKVRPLYRVVEARSIPDFLNRQKYPPLKRLKGASFEQDYIRRNLIQLSKENMVPEAGKPVLGLAPDRYEEIHSILQKGYTDKIDHLVIHPDPAVRGNLAWAMAEIKNAYTLPVLFELMKDSNPEVRRMAAVAIGNFQIMDTQGSHDQKFIEIVKMLQNYRSNSDAFGRIWAILALSSIGDKQKALYTIDLIMNDGSSSNSILGDAAPTWRSDEEKKAVQSLVEILKQNPEELSIKTQSLNALIAIESPESLDILLNYLHHIYETYHSSPSLWRYVAPHLTPPQEAENVEDVVFYMAEKYDGSHQQLHKRYLKALHRHLRRSYEEKLSGEFFQLLRFLRAFDPAEYDEFIEQNHEQIRIMRLKEYFKSTLPFWLVFWPVCLFLILLSKYTLLPLFNLEITSQDGRQPPNRRANPATDKSSQTVTPPSAIIPVKVVQKS